MNFAENVNAPVENEILRFSPADLKNHFYRKKSGKGSLREYLYDVITGSIRDDYKQIEDNFLSVGCKLFYVSERQIYHNKGFSNVYDYAREEFGLAKTSTSNLLNVVKRFCFQDDKCEFELCDKFKDYSFSKLCLLLPLTDEEIEKNINPSMSYRDIQAVKTSLKTNVIADDKNKQLNKSIASNDVMVRKQDLSVENENCTTDTVYDGSGNQIEKDVVEKTSHKKMIYSWDKSSQVDVGLQMLKKYLDKGHKVEIYLVD